jgi:hypothetical protein
MILQKNMRNYTQTKIKFRITMKILQKLFYSTIIIAFSACSGTENNTPTPKTAKDFLVAVDWLPAESYSRETLIISPEPAKVVREGDAIGLIPQCAADNYIRFKADNTWETYTGLSKCPNEPSISPLARGRYDLSTDGKVFTWKDVGTGSNIFFTVEEVTTNTKVNKLTADYFEFEKTIEVNISADTKRVFFWRWGYKKK